MDNDNKKKKFEIKATDEFLEQFAKLPKEVQEEAKKAIEKLSAGDFSDAKPFNREVHETLIDAWQGYKKAAYGDQTLPPDQFSEIRRAFFAGMHWMINELHEVAKKPEQDAIKNLDDMMREVYEILIASTIKPR